MSLPLIIQSYKAKQKSCSLQDVFNALKGIKRIYTTSNDTDDLRYLYALCLRCRHGKRMPWKYTKVGVDRLVNGNILNASFKSFEDLYDALTVLLENIPFVQGDLTLYDTAVNIGQLLNQPISPKKYVYLAAGSREGAELLLGKKKVKRKMPKRELNMIFKHIAIVDIENMLCIYKPLLAKMKAGHKLTKKEIDNAYVAHCFFPKPKVDYISKLNRYSYFSIP